MTSTQAKPTEPEYEVGYFERRPEAEINHASERAREKIRILQMDLDSIKSNHLDSLVRALKGNDQLEVRILTLDPDGGFVAGRAAQLPISLNEYKTGLHRNIREVMSALSEFPRFELRLYDDFPTQITFRIDDVVYVSTLAKNHKSRELCTFRLSTDAAGVKKSFISQFCAIWKIAREYK